LILIYINVDYHRTQDLIESVKEITEDNFDLIVTLGYPLGYAIRETAQDKINQKFLIIDGYQKINLPNVMELEFTVNEGAYLIGVLSDLKASANDNITHRFGFWGGLNNEAVNSYKAGYVQGILSILPDALFREYRLAGKDIWVIGYDLDLFNVFWLFRQYGGKVVKML
jgi:basic membrane protein A